MLSMVAASSPAAMAGAVLRNVSMAAKIGATARTLFVERNFVYRAEIDVVDFGVRPVVKLPANVPLAFGFAVRPGDFDVLPSGNGLRQNIRPPVVALALGDEEFHHGFRRVVVQRERIVGPGQ